MFATMIRYVRNRIIDEYRKWKARKRFANKEISEVFTEIYRQNMWQNEESVSGNGSTLSYTQNIRSEIPKLIKQFKFREVLDAPCGDYNWFRYVNRHPEFLYVGGDIVSELINQNNRRYGSADTEFIKLNIISDPLPRADLWICRDALFHFSNDDIYRTLRNFLSSDIEFILTSSHVECNKNIDILTGDFRLLNLEIQPFNLPPPILSINDWVEGFPVRKLCLWNKSELREAVNKLDLLCIDGTANNN